MTKAERLKLVLSELQKRIASEKKFLSQEGNYFSSSDVISLYESCCELLEDSLERVENKKITLDEVELYEPLWVKKAGETSYFVSIPTSIHFQKNVVEFIDDTYLEVTGYELYKFPI